MIRETPPEFVIDRQSLQWRLDEVNEELQQTVEERPGYRMILTFRGDPVRGSEGILADFGAKVTNEFVEAISAQVGAQTHELGERGQVPGKAAHPLYITGTAVGSFGFVLEEPPATNLAMDLPTPTQKASRELFSLLESLATNDEQVADALEPLDARTLGNIRTFLKHVQNNGAGFALEAEDRLVRFEDADLVGKALEVIGEANVTDKDETLQGKFIGALPKSMAFEFELADSLTVIKGPIAKNVNPDDILIMRGVPCQAVFQIKRVGEARPRYRLIESPRRLEE